MDNTLSIIGFLFTLISLLGSFFYVQLSNWYREVLELKTKYELNESKANKEMEQAIRECRYAYKRLFNFVPVLTTFVITAFLGYISSTSFNLIEANNFSAKLEIKNALIIFLIIYTIMILVFIIGGLVTKNKLKKVNAK